MFWLILVHDILLVLAGLWLGWEIGFYNGFTHEDRRWYR